MIEMLGPRAREVQEPSRKCGKTLGESGFEIRWTTSLNAQFNGQSFDVEYFVRPSP